MGEKISDYELVIIGGGPAGIKAGEEAKSLGINYVILERGGIAAAWQSLRPEMVMLSPCHPQRDWTSLTKNFPIWRLDVKRPFCTAEEFVNYLKEYSASFNANIKVRTEVKSVMKDKHLFKIVTSDDTYCAPLVLVTTGFLSNPFIPDIPGFRQQEYVMHSHDFRGAKSFRSKRVIVIGGGNSAAETALALCGEAQTYLFTRNKLKFFSKTKNLCHIRGISESLLLEMIQMELIRYLPDSKLLNLNNHILTTDNASLKTDYIICATGYRPHLSMLDSLDLNYNNARYYPEITPLGESVQVSNLFFAGPLARFRLSSQFIHGFVKNIPRTVGEIEKRLRNTY